MNKVTSSIGFLLLLFLSFGFTEAAWAQQEDQYRIVTTDGNVFTGTLISEDDEKVVLKTETLGEITIKRENIRKMERLDSSRQRDGSYWFANPQSTRYFFAPNAIGLKKGKGYYQNTWVLFNNINYGISDNVSIGGGIVPLFLFGSVGTPLWFLPKISVPLADNNIHLAAGAMIGGVVGEGSGGGGLLYGATTFGNTDRNLTAGIGYGYAGGDISNTPVLNISGITRVSQTVYLISENYVFPGTDFNGLISFGARWAPENFAVDFALVRPLEEAGGLIGIPWIGVTIPFKN